MIINNVATYNNNKLKQWKMYYSFAFRLLDNMQRNLPKLLGVSSWWSVLSGMYKQLKQSDLHHVILFLKAISVSKHFELSKPRLSMTS